MIGNIKKTFLPKTGMREKQLLQDPGYVDTVDTYCMQWDKEVPPNILIIFSAYIDIVDKQHSIHNSIALILCINHLNMPFNVYTTDKVIMITVSGFPTI